MKVNKQIIKEKNDTYLNHKVEVIWNRFVEVQLLDNTLSFSELGGNSIKLLMMINEINKEYGLTLTVLNFMDKITLEVLKNIVSINVNNNHLEKE